MSQRAQVRSIEAIEAFRTSLIVYLTKIRAVLEEVAEAKVRTVSWLQNEQRAYWERECRVRTQVLQEAQQILFSAKLAQFRTETAAQVLAVDRAKRALRQAEEKREAVRRWSREFEMRADPLVKHVEQLQTFVMTDLGKGALHLGALVKTLEAYAAVGGAATAPESASQPASESNAVPEGTPSSPVLEPKESTADEP